ncbi:ribosome maturation factor RimP [Propionibacteriaceae bacterium Y2011]|uniref:ribosome maturation factor RimP n=1 Tax=Microlunatus sp. Y2014 TaxID=3418488 RepID=UPI003B46AA1D
MDEARIGTMLEPLLAEFGLELEAIEVHPAGKRRILRVVVDGDGPDGTGPMLDDIAEATKTLSSALDDSPVVGQAPFTLEVTSRGLSRPLTEPKHWRRNLRRLVKVTTDEPEPVTGRITEVTDEHAVLDVDGTPRTITWAEVHKALVQVEFSKKEN